MRRSLGRGTRVATLILVAASAREAQAQTTPPTTPSAIDTSLGPITGGTRYLGLSGAFVAIAEGNEGIAINPASDAVRLGYSWDVWDYGFGVDVSVGAWLPKNDIYNQPKNSSTTKSSAFFGSLGANVYYEYAGLGVAAEAQTNAATAQDQSQGLAPSQLTANYGMVHASLAYGFNAGQVVLGAGPRLIGMHLGGGSSLFSTAGVGYEAGVIFKPTNTQYRLAATTKSPVTASVPGADPAQPTRLHVPWEVGLGLAYQFGVRPLNPRLITVDDVARQNTGGREPSKAERHAAEQELLDRYQRRERFYLLLTTEIALVEGSGAHVGLNSTDAGTASTHPLVSPRLGLESEVIPHHLKLRAGSYYESARVARTNGRIHGTGGLDVRLFEWSAFGLLEPFDFWQLSLGADAARSYLNTAFSIGFWH